jgi:excisionase family DNA binding protein
MATKKQTKTEKKPNYKLIPSREFADLIGLKIRTVQRMIHDGRIKAIKIRGRYYIPETSLTKLMKEAQ